MTVLAVQMSSVLGMGVKRVFNGFASYDYKYLLPGNLSKRIMIMDVRDLLAARKPSS